MGLHHSIFSGGTQNGGEIKHREVISLRQKRSKLGA